MTIRVLIIDDSATTRAILMSRLAGQADIAVIGTASNAAEGRKLIKQFDPDVITLDIEMPGMNGLDFLGKIMKLRPTPVIVVSGSARHGNEVTARALALGAVDCYDKADSSGGLSLNDKGKLANLVRQAARVGLDEHWPASRSQASREGCPLAENTGLIAIGSSTGGVEALQILLRDFPEDCPPTMIVQHVNSRFAPAIAKTLDDASPARVIMAEAGMPLSRGHVYVAPGGDRHLTVSGCGGYIKLQQGPPICGHAPSVDALFLSVARTLGARSVGILLTGMGSDGARGLLALARAGAQTIAQDEATSIIFGMPRAAISLGAAGVVAPIESIAQHAFAQSGATHVA